MMMSPCEQGRRPGKMDCRSSIVWSLVLVAITLPLFWSGVEAGSQYFVERPKDSMVKVGSTAILRCVIGDRKGAVQWAKDGFSLGFNHTIPGYDRYRIMSQHVDEFNLRIDGTQLSDDATYACQVLPAGGDNRLQARATLTVLVPCEPPEILNYDLGSTVEVPYTQQSLSLTCRSKLGRPAATIEWYRDDIKVTNGISNSIEPMADDKRETAISTLTIPLGERNSNRENGRRYECRAFNNVTLAPAARTHVKLSIMYPPGPPEISGYSGSRRLRTNDTLVLSCQSAGGNPPATVTWYRNTQPVDRSFKSDRGLSTNVYTFSVNPSDNNAVYRCEVTNLVTMQPLTAQYNLTVQYPPTGVTMTGGSGPVKAGRQVTLNCETSSSHPRANVTWSGRNDNHILSGVTETVEQAPGGGFITKSRFRFEVDAQDHQMKYSCRATNPEFPAQWVEDSHTFSVLYPPSAPQISGYNEGNTVRAGHLERMKCISVGGNPAPTIKWYKGNKEIKDAHYVTIGRYASSEIAIVLEADDNGARYKCKVSNAAISTPLQASIRLTVQFPPSHVYISASTTEPQAGEPMHLTCTCSSSNPAAQITWIRNGRRLMGVDLGSVEAEHGGKNTTSRLQVTPTSKDHGAIYGCRATNRALDQSQTDAITLSVKFKPEFDIGAKFYQVNATKDEKVEVNLTAMANPPASSYVLMKEGAAFTLPHRFTMSEAGVLTVSQAKKEDRGSYTVKAENAIGFAFYNFTINVKYGASIVDLTSEQTKKEGETAIFACKVEANPIIPELVTWSSLNGFDMSRASTRVEGDTTYLSIPDVTKEDTGKFKCAADNRIGTPATRTAQLSVNFSPIIDKSTDSRSAGEMGSTITLKCKAEGHPRVNWKWYRNNTEISSGDKYRSSRMPKDGKWHRTKLVISDLKATDYGPYICTARNSEGRDSHSVTVSGTSKPYPPKSIQKNNVTSSSISISWTPGFDGGLDQSFRVRYKPTNARGYHYVDVRPFGATSYKITGLELGTPYEITVLAFNDKGESLYHAMGIVVSTADTVSPSDIATSQFQESDELPVIIILVVCIVGVFILTLNIGLILFFIRRRKKRMENGTSDTTSHTNTFELYGNSHKGDNSIYPPPSDDTRSYGTYDYDKSYDDFSDDYIQNTDRPDVRFQQYSHVVKELKSFMVPPPPPVSTDAVFTSMDRYGGGGGGGAGMPPHLKDYDRANRPYSPPHKIMESPRMGGRKQTYIDDNISIGRNSPWNEVSSYKVAPPPRYGSSNGDIYDYKSNKHVGMNELSDRPSSRPSSRTGSSSVLSPNIVANPNYNGPTPQTRTPSPNDTLPAGSEFRGHLV